MTLDELIAYYEKEAEEQELNACNPFEEEENRAFYHGLAKRNKHTAEWLKELKELKARPSREAVEKEELEDYQRGYHKGLKVGKRIGAREERKTIIAYIEGKTIEEDQIEQMIKNGEVEAIPYLGETAEEEPNV